MGLLILALALIGFVLLVRFWIWRTTGYESGGTIQEMDKLFRYNLDVLNHDDAHKSPNLDERESKEMPHYDAMVDAEWEAVRANRLDDNFYEEDEEVIPLRDLLKDKKKY
jgi:hypothetical protein